MKHLDEYEMWELLEGELLPGDRTRRENHLRRCEKCAEEFERMRTDLNEMAAADIYQPDSVFWASYLPRLRQRMEEPAELTGFITQWAASLAGVAATIIFAVMLAGGFQAEKIPLFYEEWAAANLYEIMPGEYDLETVNSMINYMLTEEELTIWQTYFDDYEKSLEGLSDADWEELDRRIKNTPLL